MVEKRCTFGNVQQTSDSSMEKCENSLSQVNAQHLQRGARATYRSMFNHRIFNDTQHYVANNVQNKLAANVGCWISAQTKPYSIFNGIQTERRERIVHTNTFVAKLCRCCCSRWKIVRFGNSVRKKEIEMQQRKKKVRKNVTCAHETMHIFIWCVAKLSGQSTIW